MRRRGFLGALLGAAVLDPERLLWVPGAKTISIPRRGNYLIPPDVYVRLALERLRNEVLIKRELNREYDLLFSHGGRVPIGDTLTLRVPNRFAGLRS